jgi:chromosome segregation ATPase
MPIVPTVSGLSTRDCLLVSLTFFPLFNLIHFFLNFLFFFEEPTYPSSDSRCENRHLQQSIDKKKLEIQHKSLHQSQLSTNLEKLTVDMEKQTDIIADIEMELTKLELEKKHKRENERTCRDKREKIEAKIQQLQKESKRKKCIRLKRGKNVRETRRQSRVDNPETVGTVGIRDTGQRQTKHLSAHTTKKLRNKNPVKKHELNNSQKFV